eukprot:6378083-Heterocapsa_arctica.AAC.1
MYNRGRAFRGLLDELAFEAQNWPLKLRIRVKLSACCEEFNGDSEDVPIRQHECPIRTIGCTENN